MRKTGKNLPCEVCSSPTYVQPYRMKTQKYFYCGQECYFKHRASLPRKGTLEVECDECKGKFTRYKHLVEASTNHFCGVECYSVWKSKYGVTEITGKTSIEKTTEDILNKNNISYVYQKQIKDEKFGNCYYDFYIEDYNLLIEVDGDYWHGNPKKYPKLNSQQLGCKKRDKEKNEVALKNNYNLVRIYEDELLNLTQQQIVNKIKKQYVKHPKSKVSSH